MISFRRCFAAALVVLSSCSDEYYQDSVAVAAPVPSRPLSKRLTEWEIAKLLVDSGFKAGEIHPMICIAKHESAFRTDAIGYANQGRARGSRDIGLFQINSYYWARPRHKGGCGFTEQQLFDPYFNTQCARIVFLKQGFEGWVAFKKRRARCMRYVANLS